MNRNWLLYLMIFSLALNAGAIGTFAYLYWQGPPGAPPPGAAPPLPFRQLLHEINLDPQQRQALRAMAPEHWRKVRGLEQELMQHRQELFALIKEENLPEWPTVEAKVKEIADLQLQLEEEKVHHLMDIQKNLRPEQRQVLITQLERRLPQCCGPRRGWGHGMMRGMGGFGHNHGPHGPPGPPGPMEPPGTR
jgi:Spy/CpxP family protein refolding chaperone